VAVIVYVFFSTTPGRNNVGRASSLDGVGYAMITLLRLKCSASLDGTRFAYLGLFILRRLIAVTICKDIHPRIPFFVFKTCSTTTSK
jgi:hypothetical protein